MAKHLHIEVVAEGIEGWPQLEKLRQLGCNYAQGFFFARPKPARDCGAYLLGRPLSVPRASHITIATLLAPPSEAPSPPMAE